MRAPKLRRSEWALVLFFLYSSIFALFTPARAELKCLTVGMNATIIAGHFLLAHAAALRKRPFFSILRDWYPAPLLLMAYREMGWYAPAQHTYELEHGWVLWDRFFLYELGAKRVIESLGALLPSVLEISYSLVYTIPYFSLAVLYAYGLRHLADRFLFPFAFSVLAAYALFPYFPSEPPRTVFAGEDLPAAMTLFRRLNLWLVGSYGIHISVFPSAHCSGAFSGAFAMRYALPEKPWVWRLLLVLAVLIALATVYGRYHYLVDALSGLAIALIGLWLARRVSITPER
ncbi:MAG: phosphatase PAP2 family protein [Bryobacteraceae bacterium]